jgi:hypothetical protein
MSMPTALLITRDPSLVGPVQEAIGSVAHLGLRENLQRAQVHLPSERGKIFANNEEARNGSL